MTQKPFEVARPIFDEDSLQAAMEYCRLERAKLPQKIQERLAKEDAREWAKLPASVRKAMGQ